MAATREHADWLSLIDISGSFLSLNVVDRVFPNGPDGVSGEERADFRDAYEEWNENQEGLQPDADIHRAWIDYVLTKVLDYDPDDLLRVPSIPQDLQVLLPDHASALHPDIVIRDHEEPNAKPVLLMTVWDHTQDPEKPVKGKTYQMSPIEQMVELLRGTGIEAGLVTNGEKWAIVGAPKNEASSWGIWYAELMCDEKITLQAFKSLLSAHHSFAVPEDEMLGAMLRDSSADQQRTTDQLGYQVREAVEVLVNAIDNMDRSKELLKNIEPAVIYESALTVMMRLVFLFSAEERGLLLLGDPLYDENYAVSTLYDRLRTTADKLGEEVLERRYDAWCRLLAVFRAVYGGIDHVDLKLPAYGGSLFDPERFPFLEGRTRGQRMSDETVPMNINNRTVLHLLEALQILQENIGGTKIPRRLSFRGLNVEQIGHVYEGLLDHTAKRAEETVLSLIGAKDINAEIPLSVLEQEAAKGRKNLLDYLKKRTGRTEKALEKDLDREADEITNRRLMTVCENDEAIFQSVLPWVGLLRQDDTGYPCVFLPGSVYVTAGTERRSTGTHYTPRSLTEPVVKYTLEPLVYVGPSEGLPQVEWKLKSPAELLKLKICDMAMGSAGFLVQVVRYLSERLVESWENLARDGMLRITPDGTPAVGELSEQVLPQDPEERLILAKRLVADRCIYGVDKNPLAVEIAKLSIWLTTMDKGRPFGFLDHALKCGDSLVGADAHDYRTWTRSAFGGAEKSLLDDTMQENLSHARELRKRLEAFTVIDIRDVEAKEELAKEADDALRKVKEGCDVLVGSQLLGLKKEEREGILSNLISEYQAKETMDSYEARRLIRAVRNVSAFHWEFEFPEVFEQGGFDAFVGNPPFIGGQHITGNFGTEYRNYIIQNIAKETRGSADLCAYFLLRAFSLMRKGGNFGFITTNTISQGDTREVGLDRIITDNGTIYRANVTTPWPGQAAVFVSLVYIRKGYFNNKKTLDEKPVDFISAQFTDSEIIGPALTLFSNLNKCFQGYIVLGDGFMLDPTEANRLIQKDARNREVICPIINGKEINSDPFQNPQRFVINFYDWDITKASLYNDCFSIIKEKVYPERTKKKPDGSYVLRYPLPQRWWLYEKNRPALQAELPKYHRVLVCTVVTKYLNFSFFDDLRTVFTNAMFVLLYETYAEFAVLQSNLYEGWARKYSSTLETRLRFAPSDCFENFPFPRENTDERERTGKAFYELRAQIMKERQEGLTAVYNRFHNPDEQSPDIVEMRQRMAEMNLAVRGAYGWQDLDLDQGFHETKEGLRFTISEPARLEVLQRLLKLNHERHAEEVAAGLVSDGKSGKKPPLKKDKKQSADSDQQSKDGAVRATFSRSNRKISEIKEQAQASLFPEMNVPAPVQSGLPIDSTAQQEQTAGKDPLTTDHRSQSTVIGDWDKCVCLKCGKILAGFMRSKHTRESHNGKDPGYRKIG